MNVAWGTDTFQVETITTRADVASDLNNDYFYLYLPSGAKHYFWFDVGSAGTDPAPAGATGHEVDVAVNATASAVATALEAVIEAVTGFDSTVSGSVVTVTNTTAGYASQGHEGFGTSFAFALVTEGDTAADIGFTDGDIEVTMEEDLVEVTAHQTGTDTLSEIRTGKQVEAVVTFKETTVAQLNKLLRQAGSTYTPAGAGGSEVAGWGTHKNFLQTLVNAKKLVLHPTVLGAADKSRDLTFHLAYAKMESLTFSGESIFMVPITFKCYPKLTLNDRVEYFSFGDGSQTQTGN
jgi:hypothetical protein